MCVCVCVCVCVCSSLTGLAGQFIHVNFFDEPPHTLLSAQTTCSATQPTWFHLLNFCNMKWYRCLLPSSSYLSEDVKSTLHMACDYQFFVLFFMRLNQLVGFNDEKTLHLRHSNPRFFFDWLSFSCCVSLFVCLFLILW